MFDIPAISRGMWPRQRVHYRPPHPKKGRRLLPVFRIGRLPDENTASDEDGSSSREQRWSDQEATGGDFYKSAIACWHNFAL